MVFVGDIAHPFFEPPPWGQIPWPWAPSQAMVANFEGALVFQKKQNVTERRALFNHVSVVDALVDANVRIVSLANNHIMDMPGSLADTCATLLSRGIAFAGAGGNLAEAATPAKAVEQDETWIFLAFGWETIRCKSATPTKEGVNPLNPAHVFESIDKQRKSHPNAKTVVLMHWNYETELYPQPAHRQLAMSVINAGADAVIGHHPHRVGGIEMHLGRPIVYSLGNWWVPQGVFWGGKLTFGDETLLELAVEWTPDRDIVCHWFEYCRECQCLKHIGSEPFARSERIQQLTPFAGMSHKKYTQWFSDHRIKRRALPIYRDYRHHFRNFLKDLYVDKRHSALMLMESSGLRRLLKV